MPGWLAGVKGTTGVLGTPVDVDIPFKDILNHLDFAAELNLEVRRQRWGVILDGMYMKLSAGGAPPGPLYSTADVDVQEVIAEASLAYRLFEWDQGWLDVYAGARYFYMAGDLHLSVDRAGVRQFSQELTQLAVDAAGDAARRVVRTTGPKLKAAAQDRIDALKEEARNRLSALAENARTAASQKAAQIKEEMSARIEEIVGGRPGHRPLQAGGRHQNSITSVAMATARPGIDAAAAVVNDQAVSAAINELARAHVDAGISESAAANDREVAEALAEVARATVATKIAEARARLAEALARAKQQLSKEAQRRIQKAEAKLVKAIEHAVRDKLPAEMSGSKSWVDPIVGFRARHNFNRWLYLAARADIGGFGVSSDLEWQVYGALGVHLTKRTTMEVGYRHMDVDYTSDGFTFDAAMSGVCLTLGIEL